MGDYWPIIRQPFGMDGSLPSKEADGEVVNESLISASQRRDDERLRHPPHRRASKQRRNEGQQERSSYQGA
jgi:hypothetical protein